MNRNQERVNKNAPRFDLYLDVDGVLFANYEGEQQLRPGVNSFLKFCTKYFYCKWLTSWPSDKLNIFLRIINANNAAYKIEYITWGHLRSKAKAINYQRDFLWVEDAVDPKDRAILIEKNLEDRLVEVESEGKDDLYEVQAYLQQFLEKEGYEFAAPELEKAEVAS